MTKIILSIIFTSFLSLVCGQSRFGIQIEMGNQFLNGISSDTIVPHGYSGAEHSAQRMRYISPSLRFRKTINKKISLETGVGYLPIQHRIRLKYNYTFFQTYVDTTLRIDLSYLSVPILCNYSIPLSSNSALLCTAGFNSNLLLSKKDNFQGIIFEEIYLNSKYWYSKFVVTPSISAAYQISNRDLGTLEVGLTASRDANSFIKKDEGWGFYQNLKTARNLQYAIQLKYFFNLKSIAK